MGDDKSGWGVGDRRVLPSPWRPRRAPLSPVLPGAAPSRPPARPRVPGTATQGRLGPAPRAAGAAGSERHFGPREENGRTSHPTQTPVSAACLPFPKSSPAPQLRPLLSPRSTSVSPVSPGSTSRSRVQGSHLGAARRPPLSHHRTACDTCCRPASAPPSLRLVLPLKALDLLLTATQGPSQRLPPDLSTCPLLATWAPAAGAPRTKLPPSLSICPQLYFQPWRVGCCLGSAGRWWPTPFVFRSGQVLSPAWPPAHHSSGLLGPTSAPTKYTSQPGRVPLCLWTGQKGPGPPQASNGLCGPLGNGACSQGPMTGLFSVPSLLGHMLHMCNSVFSTLKKAHRWAPAPGP